MKTSVVCFVIFLFPQNERAIMNICEFRREKITFSAIAMIISLSEYEQSYTEENEMLFQYNVILSLKRVCFTLNLYTD